MYQLKQPDDAPKFKDTDRQKTQRFNITINRNVRSIKTNLLRYFFLDLFLYFTRAHYFTANYIFYFNYFSRLIHNSCTIIL